MPDPVSIAGLTTLKWRADSDDDGGADSPGHHSSANDFYEGFELLMVRFFVGFVSGVVVAAFPTVIRPVCSFGVSSSTIPLKNDQYP